MPFGDVVSEALQTQVKRRVIIEWIALLQFVRLGQAEAVFGQPVPREQLARIDLAGGRNVGMADHIGARYIVILHDPRDQRDKRLELSLAEFAIATTMAGVIQFDADASGIHIFVTTPIG